MTTPTKPQRRACHRCDWRTEGDAAQAELVEHAIGSGHPLCIVCARSLRDEERQSCLACLGRVRSQLAEIVALYALLPSVIEGSVFGEPAAPRERGSSESRMPGGDALVLLAAGSDGRAEDGETWRASDAPSVSASLCSWEDDWRQVRNEPVAAECSVAASYGYLQPRVGWAAGHHPAFDEFAEDVRRLWSRLLEVTGHVDRPVVAEAECFGCGAALVREWTDEGLEDEARCSGCGRSYTSEAYKLALRSRIERHRRTEVGDDELLDARTLRAVVDVPAGTVRWWASHGDLARHGRDSHGRTLYRVGDVRALVATRPSRSA